MFEDLLKLKIYSLDPKKREVLFLKELNDSLKFHEKNSKSFSSFLKKQGYEGKEYNKIEDFPYFHVNVFKNRDLISVDEKDIVRVIKSSGTSGNKSIIKLDKLTNLRQVKALNKILQEFLGTSKRDFFLIDSQNTIKSSQEMLSSRGGAIRGFLIASKSKTFLLDDSLELKEDYKEILSKSDFSESICVFGFTYLLYSFFEKHKDNQFLKDFFKKFNDVRVLHVGGWKKLADKSVDKEEFNRSLSNFFNSSKIIDSYGMTEQLGVVYPDCEEGYKHVSVLSDVLIRSIDDLSIAKIGEVGFIQIISPLPNSYPGISLLTEDLGKVVLEDGCNCGRRGKAFVFEKRANEAELKGCGDTINL